MLPGPVDFEEYEPVPATETRAAEEPVAAPLFVDEVAADEAPTDAEPGRRRVKKERTPLALPVINPRVAAVITGLLVGVAGVLLSFGASQGCEAVRGVGSCGGIGLFALLAVLLIEVLLGVLPAQGLAAAGPHQHELPRRRPGRRDRAAVLPRTHWTRSGCSW